MTDGPTEDTHRFGSGDLYPRPGFPTVWNPPRKRASAWRRVGYNALLAAVIVALPAITVSVGASAIR